MNNSQPTAVPTGEILLVEDDPALNAVMSMQLKARGFNYRSAHNGTQALQMIEERMPDLLILDVALPDLNGFEIVQILKEKPEAQAIITMIHTSADLEDQERERLTLGHTVFVTKTRACEDICSMVSHLLSKEP